MIAARNPEMFKSVTAFAPITHPTTAKQFCAAAFAKYFANADDAKHYDTVEILTNGGKGIKLPPGFVDFASLDKWEADLAPKDFERALRENGHEMRIRWQEGYSHNPAFVTSFFRDHIDFHATKLN